MYCTDRLLSKILCIDYNLLKVLDNKIFNKNKNINFRM